MYKYRKPLLDALRGQVPEHTPVWFMRQAGRYLPEYRSIRSKSKNFLNMCFTPELASEITLQPVRRFGMDAAILFADILLIPMALGLQLDFREGLGPVLQRVGDEQPLDSLIYDEAKVEPVFETVRLVNKQLQDQTAFIGFCGGPWTVACYMIDGQSINGFSEALKWVRQNPGKLDHLLDILVEASAAYLQKQIEAGADVIQIFDSWAGLLSGNDFTRFVIKPTKKLVARLKEKFPDVPVIGFPRESGENYVPYLSDTGVDALSIDQKVDLNFAKRCLQPFKPLQGNLDPQLLLAGGKEMLIAMEKILTMLGPIHIANLGHGVLPETPPENVAKLVDFIKGFRR